MREQALPSEIKLDRTWQLGAQLDEGGFGRVFMAQDEDGNSAVVKLVPQAPGSQREMLFVELDGVPNVVPILDSGETGDYLVLVMPQAEKSLRDYLEDTGRLTTKEAIEVLTDIAEALVGVEAHDVVHRDIKPENVLLLDGHWHIADFGIARFAEATTASDTLKHAKTAPYAAPEQWRGERATSATDVYALGIIAYELLAGKRPFGGPDYRHQHLEESAPTITGIPDRLRSLVVECLYKAPGARPSPGNLLARLKDSLRSSSPAGARLQQANALAVERLSEVTRQQSAAQAEAERRRELFVVAEQALDGVLALMDRQIKENAPSVQAPTTESLRPYKTPLTGWVLNGATMWLDHPVAIEIGADLIETPLLSFDVIAYTTIRLRWPTSRRDYGGRSHSLWYCNAQEPDSFRWYETAFMETFGGDSPCVPFDLAPASPDASLALSRGIHTHQVAWPFTPFDQGDDESFIERWMGWFGDAAQGLMRRPQRLPERDPEGSWRRENE